MTTPLPWSNSALDAFKNCPRSYHARWVLKQFKEAKSGQMLWGDNVHKAFELRQGSGVDLPIDLAEHEEYMRKLEAKPGVLFTELKINLDRKAKPINDAFAPSIWYRGGIDWLKADHETKTACIVDYKTGKPHEKWQQLIMYAVWVFEAFPYVELVNAQFYWTQTTNVTKKIWNRSDIPMLWGEMIGDLKLYAEAFKADIWQPRPSGLCRAWCAVTTCEHNGKYKRP